MERSETRGQGTTAARHPIGVVARRTGLSTHALRAWESRYGVVAPVRSAGGQRLYTDEDVTRLRLLRQATDLGHPISRIATLRAAELSALLREDEAVEGVRGAGVGGPKPGYAEAVEARAVRVLEDALAAARGLDAPRLHALLMRAVVQLSPGEFVERVCLPLLQRVGERWAEGRLRPAEEHVVSVAVRQVLGWLMEQVPAPVDAPVIVLTTLPGERHELGVMLAGVLAAEEGWRPVYLGPDLPPDEVAAAAHTARARAVALSMIIARAGDAAGLTDVRAALEEDVALVVGGPASRAVSPGGGVMRLDDLGALRAVLRARAEGVRAGGVA